MSFDKEEYISVGDILSESLSEEYDLEGGVNHPIEEFEELRLVLSSFLKTELLNSLVAIYKELEEDSQQPKMYAWFVRNSQYGGECKYALGALKAFKERRLDRLEELLTRCLTAVKELRKK